MISLFTCSQTGEFIEEATWLQNAEFDHYCHGQLYSSPKDTQ
jgi:hypothetical protein